MASKKRISQFIALLALLSVAFVGATSHAAPLYWANGTGPWDTSTTNWASVSGGANNTIWNNSNNDTGNPVRHGSCVIEANGGR
jgi:hypothetical protein